MTNREQYDRTKHRSLPYLSIHAPIYALRVLHYVYDPALVAQGEASECTFALKHVVAFQFIEHVVYDRAGSKWLATGDTEKGRLLVERAGLAALIPIKNQTWRDPDGILGAGTGAHAALQTVGLNEL